PDHSAIRTWMVLNLLALPGLGTWLAGKRIVGALQMALAMTGFALTGIWAGSFIAVWIRTGEIPCELNFLLLAGLGGATLFAVAWLWSLASSLHLRREARAHEQRD